MKILLFLLAFAVFFPLSAQPDLQDMSKRCFFFEPFSPVFGQLTVGYEKFTAGKRWSEEAKIGLIGLGFKQRLEDETADVRQAGIFLRYGYKFYRGKSDNTALFVKPEIYLGFKHVNMSDSLYNQKSAVWFSGFLVNVGRRYLLGDFFVCGWDAGVGYSMVKSENKLSSKAGLPVTTSYVPFNSGLIGPVAAGPRTFPIAVSLSINVGFLF
jgi:hypothetical protein